LTIGVVVMAALGSCAKRPPEPGVYDEVANIDLSAKGVSTTGSIGTSVQRPQSRGFSFFGFGSSSSPAASANSDAAPAQAIASTSEGYTIDFDNTPIATVGKAVIVDILKAGLVIDPRVTGTMTLSSGRPLKSNELLVLFENSLSLSQARLVKEAGGYRIVPSAEAVGGGRVERAQATPGYGITMIPLRYVTADNMLKLIDSFAAKPGSVKVGPTANVLLVEGSSEERRAAFESVKAFDQDWMRGQSVGIYPIANAPPETVIAELRHIMDAGEGGVARGMVQFQPIARMNAVLVIAKQPEGLRAAMTWIRRLDRSDNAASVSKVYRVKYGEAKYLAALLSDAFGTGGGSGGVGAGSGSSLSSDGLSAQGAKSGRQTLSQLINQGGQPPGAAPAGSNDGGGLFGSSKLRGGPGGVGLPDAGDAASSTGSVGDSTGTPGGRIKITPDMTTNSLLIFADRERMVTIERVLQQLDRPRLQVAIEATIAEVSLTDELQYGVQYLLRSGDLGGKPNRGSIGFSSLAKPLLERVLPGFNLVLGPGQDPRIIIDALSTRTHVKVLSNPSVVVMDNQVASIQVGDQVPVATTQATLVGTSTTGLLSQPAIPVANNIDYRNTGVILKVLPRVAANGYVTLEVEQEISNVINKDPGSQGTLTPTVSQRVIKSSISVSTGQTVLLGGLISDRRTGERQGVPILQDIAYLGDLFAHKQTGRDRTELIVFIQPRIIQDSVDAQSVAEEMRAKMIFSAPRR
jgi:general secretion pathway protein D